MDVLPDGIAHVATLNNILNDANNHLDTNRATLGDAPTDLALFTHGFSDWTIRAVHNASVPHRILLQRTTQPDYWFLHVGTIRLLPTRGFVDGEHFRFDVDQHLEHMSLCGTTTAFLHTGRFLYQESCWARPLWEWVLEQIPGEEAASESFLLALNPHTPPARTPTT